MLSSFARLILLSLLGVMALTGPASADDGYDLWLRYRPLDAATKAQVEPYAHNIVTPAAPSPTIVVAAAELKRALAAMVGTEPSSVAAAPAQGGIMIGRPDALPAVAALHLPVAQLGAEGYLIRTEMIGGTPVIIVTGKDDIGVLYGTFALIDRIQRHQPLDRLAIASSPKVKLRLLNHWDNLDGMVERGYAGQSLWDWWRLPDFKDPRYTDYARANASLGINGTVLNNVNASADSLTPRYIAKAAALADVFRTYGIRVYLSARFSAPIEIGGLKTADPLDPAVAAWWKAKADEIYRAIPDFGGFLVKANSEGQPGPQDYHRSHADGANMLAAAVAPHHGIVMWRAFVYSENDSEDRAKQAYSEFKPLDGTFADNVLLQVKNGAIDFQPREPFHPLFGAMPKTPLMMEFQITKEYLGFATHLVYLGPLFEETLEADTHSAGRSGATVAKIVEGALDGHRLSGMAGVANIGRDRDWTGSIFNQANWFVFGRMAWDPDASAEQIAREWSQLTFGPDSRITDPVTGMMMLSREAVVNYMTPLGLAHQMGTGHHYGPAPWVSDLARPEWNPAYYNQADEDGIGFDRTSTGSNAVAQYAPEVAHRFADLQTVPDKDLLWFHHLPWDYRMRSGETLWESLTGHYQQGVEQVQQMERTWAGLKPLIDSERFDKTATFLSIQEREAKWWRDASFLYFSHMSGLKPPKGYPAPAHDLDFYENLSFPYAPGH